MRTKKLVITAGMLLGVSFTFSQQNDDHFLRDYKAPDFKLRQLSVRADLGGGGVTTETLDQHGFSFNGGLSFSQISNNQKYQGSIGSVYFNTTAFSRINDVNSFSSVHSLGNTMQNRFYLNEKWFIGFHDQSSAFQQYSENYGDTLAPSDNFFIEVRPAVSIGYGRVEWVHFARQAMDVERSLQQFGRLSGSYGTAGRKDLADKIAQIRNRRYYDTRLGRIDQLQALDSVLQNNDLITTADIIYFTQLQDAFLYSYHMTRMSGSRHELGVTQGIRLAGSSGNTDLTTESYAFYSFSWFLPQSYAVQHNLRASVLGGVDATGTVNTFPIWFDASYTFGFYPTTRTYLAATANAGSMILDGVTGYMYGAFLDAYYYISPKFRFTATAGFSSGENYRTHGFSHVAVTNLDRIPKIMDYNFRFGITYDIF